MPAVARRKASPAKTRGGMDPSDSEFDPVADAIDMAKKLRHPVAKKKESGWPKMKKRLIFGTMLLLFLIAIIAAGHLWTLVLVPARPTPCPLLISATPSIQLEWRCEHIHTACIVHGACVLLQKTSSHIPPSLISFLVGHWSSSQVLLTQVSIFRELVNVRYDTRKVLDVPWFRTSQWAWFWASVIYSYGSNFGAPSRRLLIPGMGGMAVDVLHYVDLASLVMYSALLIGFVLTLKTPYYRYQVSQLAWTIAIIVVTVVQVHSFCNNVLNGLFWFLFPVSLVICNDSMAYFFGMAFGKKWIKRPLIGELSPNKTWEGFLGAALATLLFAFITPWVYVRMPFLICPCERLEIFGFSTLFLTCEYPAVFEPAAYQLPSPLAWLGGADGAVTLLPIQLHALILGTFASVVAPFGGFFASAIKRAFKLDDFGTWVPGHGGVFDRVDCQLIMGFATHTYYATFISSDVYSVSTLMALVAALHPDDQLSLHTALTKSLKQQGVLRPYML